MIEVTIKNDNCDQQRMFIHDATATAEIQLEIELDRIVSVQSQRAVREELLAEIRQHLREYQWVCTGSVNVELLWYLNGTLRQETDAIGDIDNITKPVIDALTGKDGILVDDSQIGSLHTYWSSRNLESPKDVLHLRIQFSNDESLRKRTSYL